jgi:branched-chain amino acid transport system substrate-binding protein
MLRSRKMLWLTALFSVLILILAACGAQTEEVGSPAPAPQAEAAPTEAPAAEPAATEEAAEEETEAEPTTTPAEEPAAASGEPIKIGGLAPLSAPGTVVGGEAMREAMIIAVEEINANGGLLGRPVELIIADTEGLPERGTAVMERLINQDGVVAVGGGYHSSVGITAKEVAHDNGIPVVFAETWNDTITSVMYPEVFRIAPLNSEVSAVDVNFVIWLNETYDAGIEKVVLMTENTDYGIPAAEETTRLLAESDIEAVTFSMDIGTQDFAGILERIKAENPDMVMSLLTGEASFNFQQQAADAGIGPQDVPFLCNQESLESRAFWTNVPDGNYCFLRRIGLPTQLYNDVATNFAATYSERTGKSVPESYALEAYDSIMIIAQAIEEAGSTDPQAIITTLENIVYEGVLGTITFPINSQNTPEQAGLDPKWWHQFPDPAITIVQYQEEGQDSDVAPVVFPATYQTGDPILVNR